MILGKNELNLLCLKDNHCTAKIYCAMKWKFVLIYVKQWCVCMLYIENDNAVEATSKLAIHLHLSDFDVGLKLGDMNSKEELHQRISRGLRFKLHAS